jgi:hypothetical protein
MDVKWSLIGLNRLKLYKLVAEWLCANIRYGNINGTFAIAYISASQIQKPDTNRCFAKLRAISNLFRFFYTPCIMHPTRLVLAERQWMLCLEGTNKYYCCRTQQGSTLFLTRGGFPRVHSTQSFARVMYCRDWDLVSVCEDVVIRGE